MKRGDISDEHVLELAAQAAGGGEGVVQRLVDEGWPAKVAIAKVEQMTDRGLLDYGVSPWHAWPRRRRPAR